MPAEPGGSHCRSESAPPAPPCPIRVPVRYSPSMLAAFLRRFRATPSELATTCAVFLCTGVLMNSFGRWARIAEFKHFWQIGTCYLGFVVPLALFVRGLSFPLQYCVCVAAFLPL